MKRFFLYIYILFLTSILSFAQTLNKIPESLTLSKAISIAKDSSLNAFITKNLYLSGYWRYHSFKASRLPSLTLNTRPLQYNQNFIKRYDSQNNIDIYKSQQSLNSSANLSLRQNIDFTGGVLFIDSDLGYLRSFGVDKSEQFSTIPIRIGYRQSLFGYNSFKWEKRLEPLKYKKVKQRFIYQLEEISESTTERFFNLILSKKLYKIAEDNANSSDTLYKIGLERHKIGAISKADLLTLKLERLNAKNNLTNAKSNLKKSSFLLANFLRFEPNTVFNIKLPNELLIVSISVEEAIKQTKRNNYRMIELQERLLEAEQRLEQTEKDSHFSASVSASVGFNQVANSLKQAYQDPLRQDIVSVNLSIPIVDWGVRKGRVNMAKKELATTSASIQQEKVALEQEVIMAVNDFNTYVNQIKSAEEALKVSELAYEETKQRFLIGKTDVNTLNLSLGRKTSAQRNYISSLKNYWKGYYKIRKLTLYDFINNCTISAKFENVHGF